ncbi:MAG: hypothetical protein HY965_06935 [Ignavibacteriales bacterium]|nr:hypothetical protein [Ignavibacteriales bacterium]
MGKFFNTFYNALAAPVGITKCTYFRSGTILFPRILSSIYFFNYSKSLKKPLLFFFILLLTVNGCKKHSATDSNDAAITLRVDDVASTEAWLKITSIGVALPTAIEFNSLVRKLS